MRSVNQKNTIYSGPFLVKFTIQAGAKPLVAPREAWGKKYKLCIVVILLYTIFLTCRNEPHGCKYYPRIVVSSRAREVK